jgi:hypothetical protein
MATATKAPAKRATYKQHGHPAEFAFFGTGTKPETGKAVASCESSAHGFDLRDKAGKLIISIGVATKFWAGALADGTWGEVAGTQALPDEPKPAKQVVTNEDLGKQGDQGAAPKYCGCGCGMSVSRHYRPGHDARHSGELRRAYEAGTLTREQALAAVAHSPLLVSKLGRALDLASARMAAKSTETTK